MNVLASLGRGLGSMFISILNYVVLNCHAAEIFCFLSVLNLSVPQLQNRKRLLSSAQFWKSKGVTSPIGRLLFRTQGCLDTE